MRKTGNRVLYLVWMIFALCFAACASKKQTALCTDTDAPFNIPLRRWKDRRSSLHGPVSGQRSVHICKNAEHKPAHLPFFDGLIITPAGMSVKDTENPPHFSYAAGDLRYKNSVPMKASTPTFF